MKLGKKVALAWLGAWLWVGAAMAQVPSKTFYEDKPGSPVREEFFTAFPGDTAKIGTYRSYYPDGKLRLEGIFADGQRNGPFVEYYPNGKPKFKAEYENGYLNGRFESYSEEGKPLSQSYFVRDRLQDTVVTYYPDGSIKGKSLFSADWPEGRVVVFYEGAKNSNEAVKKFETEYAKGKPNGLHREYYRSGVKSLECNYKGGFMTGFYRTYYPNGQLEQEYTNDTAGQKTGSYTYYNPAGVLLMKHNYLNNKKHGEAESWYENGTKKFEGAYKNGFLVGKARFYRSDKSVWKEVESSEDEKVKQTTLYWPGGGIREVNKLQGTRKLGTWKWFSSQGKLYQQESYNEYGKLDGTRSLTDSLTGKLLLLENWKLGKREGLTREYYPDGTPKTETYWATGQKSGSYVTYHPNGQVEWKGQHLNGKPEGTWTQYSPQGLEIQTQNYAKGRMVKATKAKTKAPKWGL